MGLSHRVGPQCVSLFGRGWVRLSTMLIRQASYRASGGGEMDAFVEHWIDTHFEMMTAGRLPETLSGPRALGAGFQSGDADADQRRMQPFVPKSGHADEPLASRGDLDHCDPASADIVVTHSSSGVVVWVRANGTSVPVGLFVPDGGVCVADHTEPASSVQRVRASLCRVLTSRRHVATDTRLLRRLDTPYQASVLLRATLWASPAMRSDTFSPDRVWK